MKGAPWSRRVDLLVLALSGAVSACDRKDAEKVSGTEPTVARSAESRAQPAEVVAPPVATMGQQAARLCRALDLTGAVTNEKGVPLAALAAIDSPLWLELGAAASTTIVHVASTRQVRLRGPGRVRVCDDRAEQFLVDLGQIETTAVAGARPGAQVLLASPHGTVSYADAELTLTVGARSIEVAVRRGEAWFEAVGKAAKPERVTPTRKISRSVKAVDVKSLVDACTRAAEQAEAKAGAVLSPSAEKATLGPRAAAHLRARQAARKACAAASAALFRVEPVTERERVQAAVEHAEDLWRRVPPPSRSTD